MMIINIVINGKKATVAYMTRDFEPVPWQKAEIMEIHYEDGMQLIAAPQSPEELRKKKPEKK